MTSSIKRVIQTDYSVIKNMKWKTTYFLFRHRIWKSAPAFYDLSAQYCYWYSCYGNLWKNKNSVVPPHSRFYHWMMCSSRRRLKCLEATVNGTQIFARCIEGPSAFHGLGLKIQCNHYYQIGALIKKIIIQNSQYGQTKKMKTITLTTSIISCLRFSSH